MPTIDPSTTQRRTALVLLNTVLGELGMSALTSVTEGSDTAAQLLYLANGFGSRVAQLPFWSELEEEFTVTTDDGVTAYDLPADWGVPLAGTAWDRTSSWPIVGPMTSVQWQYLQSGLTSAAGPRYRFRFNSLQMQVDPAPGAGVSFVHAYLSSGWVLGLSGETATVRKPRITSDDDYILLSEEMFITGVKALWLGTKGLDNSGPVGEFRRMIDAAWANSSSAPILTYGEASCDLHLLGYGNIPDSGYGP